MWSELPKSYWYLAALRLFLVFAPQPGYIHPDEFFQSIEVLVGKVFEVEASPPWEFNSTFPIRSMTIPYFTLGVTYQIIKVADMFIKEYTGSGIITPYVLLVAPRLIMCVLSFLVDFSLYKICVNNNEKYMARLLILVSSYVMIIYATRTFSNTMELIFFALLLYYVAESLVFSNILIKKREYLNYRYENSKTTVEKVKFHKLKLYMETDSLRNCFPIATLTVLGFFNRPTFLGFALFPIFFWLYRGLGNKLVMSMNFHLRIFVFILCCTPTILFCVLIDSFYYGYLTWGEIGIFDICINNFVFAPFNFLKYNIETSNLAKHGLHPRYLHALINIPLLFNVLGVCALWGLVQYAQHFVRGKHHLLPTVRSIKGLMLLSAVTPVALLSIFPHQEPRFLIPIIVPLVYLYGPWILPETNNTLVQSDNSNIPEHSVTTKRKSATLLGIWWIFNVTLAIFYGFIHQSGVFPVTNFLSNDMRLKPPGLEYHIVTSHIYSMPESFLLQKSTDKLYFAKNRKYSVNKRAFLYEEGSLKMEKLMQKIIGIIDRNEAQKKYKANKKYKLFLVIPSTLEEKLNYFMNTYHLKLTEIAYFFPHISTETIPDLIEDICFIISNIEYHMLYYYLQGFVSLFSLKLYEVTPQVIEIIEGIKS